MLALLALEDDRVDRVLAAGNLYVEDVYGKSVFPVEEETGHMGTRTMTEIKVIRVEIECDDGSSVERTEENG